VSQLDLLEHKVTPGPVPLAERPGYDQTPQGQVWSIKPPHPDYAGSVAGYSLRMPNPDHEWDRSSGLYGRVGKRSDGRFRSEVEAYRPDKSRAQRVRGLNLDTFDEALDWLRSELDKARAWLDSTWEPPLPDPGCAFLLSNQNVQGFRAHSEVWIVTACEDVHVSLRHEDGRTKTLLLSCLPRAGSKA
jgi:hypothetical protein